MMINLSHLIYLKKLSLMETKIKIIIILLEKNFGDLRKLFKIYINQYVILY
jgi:hypothetical protein